MLSRTVFGFQIKATGMSETAAVASGISVKRMILAAMLISGAVAGLIGMPELLNGTAASYSLNFPGGIGFTGIAIALLGRNHPVGMVFSALLWSALDSSSNSLQGVDVPKELVTIMQGVILFSVVIAYELVRRYRITLEQKDVARALAATARQEVCGMTTLDEAAPVDRPVPRRSRSVPPWVWLLIVVAGIAVVSAIRLLSDASNLTSSGAIQSAITAAVPIALAGLSGLWSERSGVVNIGIEGMMILGTFGAGWAGYQWGPWAGVFFGAVCGALGGLLHAMATVTFGVDHIISGVAINIIAPGITLYLAKLLFTDAPGGGQKQSPPVARRHPDHHSGAERLARHHREEEPVLRLRPGRHPARHDHQRLAAHRAHRAADRRVHLCVVAHPVRAAAPVRR